MKQVSPTALIIAGVIAAAIVWVTALGFYGYFPPIKPYSGLILWIIAIICGVLGLIVRRRLADGEVGIDRSQINPMSIAFNAVLGQSAAWIGSIFCGGYVGMALYVWLSASFLTAAQNDTPGVIFGALGGAVAAIAGVWLERGCIAPPGEGEQVG